MRVRLVAVVLAAVACSACRGTSPKAEPGIRVPNVIGASWGTAIDRINRAGLCIGRIRVDPTTMTSPADRVLRQSPRPGARVARHARISITVSPSGPSGSIVSYSLRGCRDAVQYYVEPGS
jgi:beta-lactam-binding protein with PASTA domain